MSGASDKDIDLRDQLVRAWDIVDSAGLPEHVQADALRAVLGWISDDPSSQPAAERREPAAGRRPIRTPPADTVTPPTPAGSGSGVSEDGFFASLANDAEVSEDDLRQVFVFTNERLELAVPKSKLGADSAERYRTVAVLMVPALRILEDVKTVPSRSAKAIAERYGATDPSRNYAKYVGTIPGYTFVGDRTQKSFALRPGWEKEFAATLSGVLGKGDE